MELSIIPVISVLRSLKQEDCYEFETSYPDSPELQCETLSKNKINKKLKRPINVFFTCLCSPGSNRYPDWVRAGATQNQAMPDSLMAEWYAFWTGSILVVQYRCRPLGETKAVKTWSPQAVLMEAAAWSVMYYKIGPHPHPVRHLPSLQPASNVVILRVIHVLPGRVQVWGQSGVVAWPEPPSTDKREPSRLTGRLQDTARGKRFLMPQWINMLTTGHFPWRGPEADFMIMMSSTLKFQSF